MRVTDPARKRGRTFKFTAEQLRIAIAVLVRREKEESND